VPKNLVSASQNVYVRGDGTFDTPPSASGAGSGTVTSVTAADTSIVVSGTDTIAPSVATGTLDVIATQHPPAASVPMNSQKLTGLANGSSSGDSAAFGQIPVADTTAGHIEALGSSASAGSNGEWADSGHVHPDTGVAMLAGATMTGYLAPAVVSLTFTGSGTTAVPAASGNAFALTLTASTTTLGAPSNPVDGQVIRFRITQGGSGSYTLSYASAYDFGTAGSPTLSTSAGKVDILGFEYVAALTKWAYLGSGLGF
jgi:hypothetical protein